MQKDERGAAGDGVAETIALALSEASYAKIAKGGMIHQRAFPRQAGATTLRIVVREAETGAVGSLTIPFSRVPKNDPPLKVMVQARPR